MARKVERYKQVNGQQHRYCSTCKQFLPLSTKGENTFSSRSASPDGLAYSCKTCERETAKKSYKKKNRKKADKQRYQDNREVRLDQAKARYVENREDILDKSAQYRQTEQGKKVMSESAKKRRERMAKNTPGGRDYVEMDVIEKCTLAGRVICGVCGEEVDTTHRKEWHVDHIIPIASGGADHLVNVQVTHKTCNLCRPKNGSDIGGL